MNSYSQLILEIMSQIDISTLNAKYKLYDN